MCTIKFLENFFRKIWYLLGNYITMLRKAKETKRQIIESLNKRLLNENQGLDDKFYEIIKNGHYDMYTQIEDALRNDKDLQITHLNPDVQAKFEDAIAPLYEFLSNKLKDVYKK